jgi:simple sugar transport system permease protein
MNVLTQILTSGVAFAIPLLVAAVGELISERAGVLNLSVEGMMLTGAFAAVVGAVVTDSSILGALIGILAALIVGAAQGLLSVRLRADQIVTGIAINAVALGATTYGARLLLSEGRGQDVPGFAQIEIPVLSDIPAVGGALFSHSVLGWVCIAIVMAVVLYLSPRTVRGLTIDATGEDAKSADFTGLPVSSIRFFAVLLTAAMSGLAGAQLALSEVGSFTDNMTAGMGYLAVVAVIAGRWRAVGVIVACAVFGVAQALQFAMPAIGVEVPSALLIMLPYLLAIIAMSGIIGLTRAPSGLTKPFVRAG